MTVSSSATATQLDMEIVILLQTLCKVDSVCQMFILSEVMMYKYSLTQAAGLLMKFYTFTLPLPNKATPI